MTCGIYKLYFKEVPTVYIGKAINIEARYNSHTSQLRNNVHKNKALTKNYTLYSEPILEVVEELPLDDDLLYKREKHWILVYNSFINGMNENEGGRGSGHGETHNQAKYTNNKYVSILKYLCAQPPLPLKTIVTLTDTDLTVVTNISKQSCHLWMKEEYPTLWETYSNIRAKGYRRITTNAYAGTEYKAPVLISPEGVEFIVERTTIFSREHGLQAGNLANVINGKRKSHKGWTLKKF